MILGSMRGHLIYNSGQGSDDWFYMDDHTLVNMKDERPCSSCGIKAAWDEPDPCLGYLEGVKFACCGHDATHVAHDPYVSFANGTTLRGDDALSYFEGVKKR